MRIPTLFLYLIGSLFGLTFTIARAEVPPGSHLTSVDINDSPGASPSNLIPGRTEVIREGRDYNMSGPGVGASISWNCGEDTFHFA